MRVPPELVLRVASVRRETPSTRAVRLALDGARFDFWAGQAATIGPSDRVERVPYSLACAPAESRREGILAFLIKVESSGRWGHLFDDLQRGMRVAVRGPYGTFVLPRRLQEHPLLFIAGGTGIAPVRSMIVEALQTHRPRRLRLLYSARTPSDFAFLRELRRLSADGRLDMRLHVTREAPPRWRGHRGRITRTHLQPLLDDPRTLCFVCGPAPMVADVPRTLAEMGVDRARITVEEW